MSVQSDRAKRFLAPVLVILVGTMWLLNVLDVMPEIDWLWTGGLASAGILLLAFGGINKVTVVTGPWLLVASVCSVLRATGRLVTAHEIPILTVVLGLLLLLVEILRLPLPRWLRDNGEAGEDS